MKKIQQLFFHAWRPVLLIAALAVLAYVLFFHSLGQIPNGYAPREKNTYLLSANYHTILQQPVNAPYKLFVLLLIVLGHHSLLYTRIVAASFGIVASMLFFAIVQVWYGYRTAFLSTLMFATSSGFLHIARLGSTSILQMSIMVLISLSIWHRHTKKQLLVCYLVIAALAVLWYVPAMIWFEIVGIFILRKRFTTMLQEAKWLHKGIWAAMFALIISPLIIASVKLPSLLYTIFGLPKHFASPIHILATIGSSILSIGVRSNGTPTLWVGHAPLLNVAELVFLVMGIYLFARHLRTPPTLFLFSAIILSLILIGLGGAVNISSLVPLLYLLIAGGLSYFLKQWLHVFPRNPFARFTGIAVLFVIVFFSALYQVRLYFVAWPHNSTTKQTFDQHSIN